MKWPCLLHGNPQLNLTHEVLGSTYGEVNAGATPANPQDIFNYYFQTQVDLEGSRERSSSLSRHNSALRLFYSYSHKDELLRDELETHLKILERQNLIQPWHDRRIMPGTNWKQELDYNLQQADIILLLISADFVASDYCYEIEMADALKRHDAGEAIVIPILLRQVNLNKLRRTPHPRVSRVGSRRGDKEPLPGTMLRSSEWSG